MKKLFTLIAMLLIQVAIFGQNNQRYTTFEEALIEPGKVKWLDLVYSDLSEDSRLLPINENTTNNV